MKMYRAQFIGAEIGVFPISVEKQTANSVWIKGRTYRKTTQYEGFFETAEEAWDALEAFYLVRLEKAKGAYSHLRKIVLQIESAKQEFHNRPE
jgi:hypothetical protein